MTISRKGTLRPNWSVTRRSVLALVAFSCTYFGAFGQATSTASRAGDLQVGVGYSNANANYNYVTDRIRGVDIYADFDVRHHVGLELNFHQLNDPSSAVYQRTYEVGGRYVRHIGRLAPYAKGMYGRGVLNFPKNVANLAYNLLAAGAGVDLALRPRVNVRAEFEYQDWISAPGAGLQITPSLLTVGVAYHFGGGRPR